jgi:hypothetical protein
VKRLPDAPLHRLTVPHEAVGPVGRLHQSLLSLISIKNKIISDYSSYSSVFKGQYLEIFDFRFFFMNRFPQAHEYTIKAVSNFSKIRRDICSSRCNTGVADTGVKLKKSSNRKIFITVFL